MTSNFAVIEAQRDGLPALIVVDLGLDPESEAASFPYLVTMVLPIAAPLANGLCTQEESEQLADLEDALLEGIHTPAWRYVGRVTWNGSRNVMLYAEDREMILEQLRNALSAEMPRIEVHVSHEPDWATWRQFLPKNHGKG